VQAVKPQETIPETKPEQPKEPLKEAIQKIDSLKSATLGNDSLKKAAGKIKLDSASTVSLKDTNAVKKVQKVVNTQEKINQAAINAENKPETLDKMSVAKKDTTYQKWIKKTGKLYESMDAKKAAKIILGYSDNIARDLLLSMRKKKAAEILSEIKPEIASRIISLN
jgi:flagellar motility protein MotE (MotC chaperone)